MERLDKAIAHMGQYSRSEIKILIKKGQITVNGVIADKEDRKINPDVDTICVSGKEVGYQHFTYLLLHKPGGVLTATEDARQKTVLDLLPKEERVKDLAPVGRLDKDTEGLLILTNDGVLAHQLLSPKSHVDKCYYAEVDGVLTEQDVRAFDKGIHMENGEIFAPGKLEILEDHKGLVTIHEGKFHQVKKMMLACGKTVTYLKRISMGPLTLDEDLGLCQFRHLTAEEVDKLKHLSEK